MFPVTCAVIYILSFQMKTYKQQILQHRQDESNAERRCPINKKTKMQK